MKPLRDAIGAADCAVQEQCHEVLHVQLDHELGAGWREADHELIVTLELKFVDNAKLRALEVLVRPETARVVALRNVECLQHLMEHNEARFKALTRGGGSCK